MVGRLARVGQETMARDTVEKNAVSEKMKKLGQEIIGEILKKGNHHQELKTVKFVKFDEFKNELSSSKRTILEDWILGIEKVERIPNIKCIDDDGYIVHHSSGVMVLKFYKIDDAFYKIKTSDKKKRVGWEEKREHYRFTIYSGVRSTSVSYERLVMIADAIYCDSLPSSLRGLQCNVKDCTGNPITAGSFGLKCNFHPNNLEWVFESEHGSHYSTCKKAFEITGKPWIVSALDRHLYELSKNGTNAEIAQYLDWFCVQA